MDGRGFLPNFIRPVHAWAASSSAAPNPVPAPLPVPTFGYSQPATSSSNWGLSIQPVPALALAPVPLYRPAALQPTQFQAQALGAPLFPFAAAVAVEDEDTQEVSDGSIPEILFRPGKTSDLDRAIAASGQKCFIGK